MVRCPLISQISDNLADGIYEGIYGNDRVSILFYFLLKRVLRDLAYNSIALIRVMQHWKYR